MGAVSLTGDAGAASSASPATDQPAHEFSTQTAPHTDKPSPSHKTTTDTTKQSHDTPVTVKNLPEGQPPGPKVKQGKNYV